MTCNLPNTTSKAASDISTDPAAPAVSSFCVMFDNDDHAQEIVREIALKDLQIHPENPFIVETQNAPSMKELVESIRTNGIQTPLIVRPYGNGYQIISGHRRYFASIYAGRTSLPCIVREMDDNTARIVMCDANQQRKVTHIELALAIRLKIVALKNMGREERIQYALEKLAEVDPDGDLLDNIKAEPKIYNILAAIYGVSPTTIKNISRLNELTPELLDRIRDNKVSPSAGRQLSFLTAAEQDAVAKSIDDGCHVSVSQAEKLHALSRNGNLDVESIPAVMKKNKAKPTAFREDAGNHRLAKGEKNEEKNNGLNFNSEELDEIERLFMLKGNYTNRRMHDKILELVAEWSRQQSDSSYTIFSNEIESAGVDMSDCKNQGRTRDCVAAVAQIFSRFGQRLVDAPLLYEALCTNEKLMTAAAPHFEAIKAAMDTCLAEAPVGKKPRF